MARDLADMESTLEITAIAAEGLKDVKTFGKMNVYVDAHLSGGESSENQRTPVHEDGGTNPSWSHALVFTIDGAAARAGRLTLHFNIKAQRTHRSDKDVGQVDVPVRELLEQGGAGDGTPKVLSRDVRLPSGETKGGVLEFSYKFDGVRLPSGHATPPQPQARKKSRTRKFLKAVGRFTAGVAADVAARVAADGLTGELGSANDD